MKPIVFFDAECPFCQNAVRWLVAVDHKGLFLFAPLGGKTAKKRLKKMIEKEPELDALVLLQPKEKTEARLFIGGKASLRILWLLGGKYRLLGWLSFLPGFLFTPFYRLVAHYRYQLLRPRNPREAPESLDLLLQQRLLP